VAVGVVSFFFGKKRKGCLLFVRLSGLERSRFVTRPLWMSSCVFFVGMVVLGAVNTHVVLYCRCGNLWSVEVSLTMFTVQFSTSTGNYFMEISSGVLLLLSYGESATLIYLLFSIEGP
jgi:hypothetical protein